jgi:hypothetical protein
MENYGVGDPEAEWPNNIISRRPLVYASGVIARAESRVRHAVDPEEFTLCRRLAAAAARIMSGVAVGMGSESSDPFREFFIVANIDEPAPSSITEDFVRSKFGGTIFPPATITVEPLRAAGVWWSDVEQDGSESGEDYFGPWLAMIRWFQNQPELIDSAFVRIGDRRALWDLTREKWPEGTELTDGVLPRLALGLSRGGSLTGLFGYSVQT